MSPSVLAWFAAVLAPLAASALFLLWLRGLASFPLPLVRAVTLGLCAGSPQHFRGCAIVRCPSPVGCRMLCFAAATLGSCWSANPASVVLRFAVMPVRMTSLICGGCMSSTSRPFVGMEITHGVAAVGSRHGTGVSCFGTGLCHSLVRQYGLLPGGWGEGGLTSLPMWATPARLASPLLPLGVPLGSGAASGVIWSFVLAWLAAT